MLDLLQLDSNNELPRILLRLWMKEKKEGNPLETIREIKRLEEFFHLFFSQSYEHLANIGLRELQELAEQVLFKQAVKVLEIKEAQSKHDVDSSAYHVLMEKKDVLKTELTRIHHLFHDQFGLVEAKHDRFYEQNPLVKTDEVAVTQ